MARSLALPFTLTLLFLAAGCEKERPTPPPVPPSPLSAPTAQTDAGAGAPDAGTAGDPKWAIADAGASGAAAAGVSKEAQELFASRCSVCHGPQGTGTGPGAVALNPKPRNFQNPAWQQQVTDEHIEKIIVQGGPAVGKSPAMPPNPDLAGKPVVQELRKLIRSFGQK